MIEDRGSGSEQAGPPTAGLGKANSAVLHPTRNAGRGDPTGAEPVLVLKVGQPAVLVERDRAAQRVLGRAGPSVFGSDQDDALAGPGPVDGAGCGTLENLHVLDVVRIEVDRPIRRRGAAVQRPAGDVVVGNRVVDRYAVDHEERLSVLGRDGGQAAYLNERGGAGITRARGHLDIGCLGRQRIHHVRLVASDDGLRVNAAAACAKLLHLRCGAGTGYHDLTQLQRVVGEAEILNCGAGAQIDLSGPCLEPDQAGGHGHRPRRHPGPRNQDGVAAVGASCGSRTQLFDDDGRRGQRLPCLAGDPAGKGGRLLSQDLPWQERKCGQDPRPQERTPRHSRQCFCHVLFPP
jgi:hypothetical protein